MTVSKFFEKIRARGLLGTSCTPHADGLAELRRRFPDANEKFSFDVNKGKFILFCECSGRNEAVVVEVQRKSQSVQRPRRVYRIIAVADGKGMRILKEAETVYVRASDLIDQAPPTLNNERPARREAILHFFGIMMCAITGGKQVSGTHRS